MPDRKKKEGKDGVAGGPDLPERKKKEVQTALPALSASATEEPAARLANVAPATSLDTSDIQAEFDGDDDETAALLQRPQPQPQPPPMPSAATVTATTAMDMDEPASTATAAAAAPVAVGIASIPAGEKPKAALDTSDTLAAHKLLREAFFACDINQGGTIDAKELCAMLSALNDDRGVDVTLEVRVTGLHAQAVASAARSLPGAFEMLRAVVRSDGGGADREGRRRGGRGAGKQGGDP